MLSPHVSGIVGDEDIGITAYGLCHNGRKGDVWCSMRGVAQRMDMLQWDVRFETGDDAVDHERKKVFDMVRKVFSLEFGDRNEMNNSSADFLVKYAGRRFAAEEALMDRSAFVSAAEHKKQHREFEKQIKRLKENFALNGGSFSAGIDVNDVLISWLVIHVMGSDKILVDHCKKAS